MKKFPTLAGAGRELAGLLPEYRGAGNTFVVAIASGGVPVAFELARELQLPLELLIIRRLLAAPDGQEPLCAVNIGGTLIVDERVGQRPATPSSGMDYAIADGLEQLAVRERSFRGDHPPTKLAGKNVLLVDNGIHTGSTILAAIRALRTLKVGSIVAAVPIADPSSRAAIELATDRLVCAAWPEKLGHVGLWYQERIRPTEERVRELFAAAQQDFPMVEVKRS